MIVNPVVATHGQSAETIPCNIGGMVGRPAVTVPMYYTTDGVTYLMRDIEPGSMVFSFNAPVNSVLFFPLPDTATLPDAIDGLTLIASAGNAKLYQVKGPDAIEFHIERAE